MQVNTSELESTGVSTNQHESDAIQHESNRVNTNQHESDTSQHESIRLRNYHSLL